MLRIIIICPRCNRQREVHIFGAWDIKDVKHDCKSVEGFKIVFVPGSRPVF